jgi:hypothetical protein
MILDRKKLGIKSVRDILTSIGRKTMKKENRMIGVIVKFANVCLCRKMEGYRSKTGQDDKSVLLQF